eukprot:NODE_4834_length_549_cov_1062.338000_g3536_i0.p1 GENE.NODE_4834_length_549_cov_1062.338000_g3536_i0~~NODE_4834_length_549_cov_1062.338000_g3536_i0.p1  ORF type:complete len:142 (+),score=48.55 NODE_4834_length_549_cov_1062.338000_g3536_i0:57-428(+)
MMDPMNAVLTTPVYHDTGIPVADPFAAQQYSAYPEAMTYAQPTYAPVATYQQAPYGQETYAQAGVYPAYGSYPACALGNYGYAPTGSLDRITYHTKNRKKSRYSNWYDDRNYRAGIWPRRKVV